MSHALIFETLRLVLLVCLMIVRLGTAGVRSVEKWLDEGMLDMPDVLEVRDVLDQEHKEGWVGTKESEKWKDH